MSIRGVIKAAKKFVGLLREGKKVLRLVDVAHEELFSGPHVEPLFVSHKTMCDISIELGDRCLDAATRLEQIVIKYGANRGCRDMGQEVMTVIRGMVGGKV